MIHLFAPVRVAAMQHGQLLQFLGNQVDTNFFRSLPNGSVDRRLPQFDVARSSVSPVSVHESRALAQLQQHLAPLYRVASPEHQVHSWYQRKLIGHTTTHSSPCNDVTPPQKTRGRTEDRPCGNGDVITVKT